MSPRKLLLFFVCFFIRIHQSTSKCPSVIGSLKRSTTAPEVANGTNYTIYQEFVTDRGAESLEITWIRKPFIINFTTENVHMENTVVNSTTLRASLTLWDIQVVPTRGVYTVTAINDCSSTSKTNFYLHVEACNVNNIPQPNITENSTTLAEPNLNEYLQLTANFHGSTSLDYVTIWNLNGDFICLESSSSSHDPGFSCNRTLLSPCWFQANLWIHSPSYTSTGDYSVRAAVGDDRGNSCTIDLGIERQPEVKACSPETVTNSPNRKAQFQCTVSNYSDSVQVVIVEDNEREYNESTEDLSFGCRTQIVDSTLATCTVNISSFVHSGKRKEYQLCVGYNSSVADSTPLRCSGNVVVEFSGETGNHKLTIIGLGSGVPGIALLLMVVGATICVVRHVRRTSEPVSLAVKDPTVNDPTRPLLFPPADLTLVKASGQDTVTDSGKVSKRNSSKMNQRNATGAQSLWTTVNTDKLQSEKLVHIAEAIPRWENMAEQLGLIEQDIIVITEDHRGDYKEQKYQMLLKWYQLQEAPPTNQTLVRIFEENVSPQLAQDIVRIVGSTNNISS